MPSTITNFSSSEGTMMLVSFCFFHVYNEVQLIWPFAEGSFCPHGGICSSVGWQPSDHSCSSVFLCRQGPIWAMATCPLSLQAAYLNGQGGDGGSLLALRLSPEMCEVEEKRCVSSTIPCFYPMSALISRVQGLLCIRKEHPLLGLVS